MNQAAIPFYAAGETGFFKSSCTGSLPEINLPKGGLPPARLLNGENHDAQEYFWNNPVDTGVFTTTHYSLRAVYRLFTRGDGQSFHSQPQYIRQPVPDTNVSGILPYARTFTFAGAF